MQSKRDGSRSHIPFRPSLIDLLGGLLTFSLFFSRDSLLGDPGVGWHVRAGQWMREQGEILFFDPFLLNDGAPRPWVHDQWLSDVLLSLCFSVGGFPLLHLLVAVVCISVFIFILPGIVRTQGASSVTLFLALFLGALQASVQWFVRPVIFSFLFFALVYRSAVAILNNKRIDRPHFVLLPLLFAFWANMHAGFWLGLFVLGSLFVYCSIRRLPCLFDSLLLTLLCLCATLLNPSGAKLWRSTLGLAFDPYFLKLNQEWLPPELLDAAFLPFTFSILLLVVGVATRGFRRMSIFDYLILVPLLVVSLLHRRYLPFYGIALVLPVAKLFPQIAPRPFGERFSAQPIVTPLWWGVMFASVLSGHGVIGFQAHTSAFPSNYPAREAAAIAANPGPVFHTPDVGGYLTWIGWPVVRPFIDDRNQLLGRGPYEEYFRIVRAEPGWERSLREKNFKWVLLREGDALVDRIGKDPKWEQVSFDSPGKWLLYKASTEPAVPSTN